jgi:hypothetical protein
VVHCKRSIAPLYCSFLVILGLMTCNCQFSLAFTFLPQVSVTFVYRVCCSSWRHLASILTAKRFGNMNTSIHFLWTLARAALLASDCSTYLEPGHSRLHAYILVLDSVSSRHMELKSCSIQFLDLFFEMDPNSNWLQR